MELGCYSNERCWQRLGCIVTYAAGDGVWKRETSDERQYIYTDSCLLSAVFLEKATLSSGSRVGQMLDLDE